MRAPRPKRSPRPRVGGRKKTKKLSGVTMAEAAYWSELIEEGRRVRATLKTRDEVEGVVEYFDARFIRLSRDGEPTLMLYKGDILYVSEVEET